MALLTGWTGKEGYAGPNNRVQEEAPKTLDVPTGTTTILSHLYLIVQRTESEKYRFVGMSYATAVECQAAMLAAITYSSIICGDVSVTPQGGNMWQCSVQFNRVTQTITDITPS